jgi:hypothetical protein
MGGHQPRCGWTVVDRLQKRRKNGATDQTLFEASCPVSSRLFFSREVLGAAPLHSNLSEQPISIWEKSPASQDGRRQSFMPIARGGSWRRAR